MVVNLIFAVIMDPKESLNNNVILAFLGSVSEKLRVKCDWSNEAYQTAVQACVRKNDMGKDSILAECFRRPDVEHGSYVRRVIAEIDDFTVDTELWERDIVLEDLEVCFRFYNRQDSVVAITASEMADLHLNDKGMSNFDAFEEGSLRHSLLSF